VTTPASRGSTGPTTLVLDDLTSILRAQLPSAAPLFLMGHSMGGAEVLYYAAHGPLDVRRQIVGFLAESPWIVLDQTTQPSRALVLAGRLAARVIPKRQMVQKVEARFMSRDEAVCQAFEKDDLAHDRGTFEGFAGMLARAAELDAGLARLADGKGEGEQYRIWVAHGSGDRVTSYEASKQFVARLDVTDKEFKTYDGWFHKCKFWMIHEIDLRHLNEMTDSCVLHSTCRAGTGQNYICQ
jgi:acylglycerol lipase